MNFSVLEVHSRTILGQPVFPNKCEIFYIISQVFAPHIVCYLELEEETLKEDLDEALERETWLHCSEVRHPPPLAAQGNSHPL